MNNLRIFSTVILFFVILIIIIVRLVNLQIIHHDEYLFKAERQQFKTKEVYANRGLICDVNGDILAYNINVVDFFVDTRMCDAKKREIIADKFSSVLGIKKQELLDKINSSNRNVCVAKDVTLDKALELKNFVIDGLFYEEKQLRAYPFNKLASHIIGYVNKELTAVDGIEKVYNKYLSGQKGLIYYERDVRGRIVQIQNDLSVQPKDGADVFLTIDRVYQQILEDELDKGIKKFSANYGIGIIMNPQNGDVLALASLPSYDPNDYGKYSNDERRNKAITDLYEPGSTFKSIALATFIDNNLVKDNEIIDCSQPIKVSNVTIKDDHGVGAVRPIDILAHSSNIGMAKLSTRIGIEDFYYYLRNFGFGNITGLGLPGEVNGILPKPNSINQFNKMYMSFGYNVSVTPIQMITSYCALVNGGTLYKPNIVKKIVYKQSNKVEEIQPQIVRTCISKNTSDKIKEYMKAVVEYGTARRAFEDFKFVEIGGKTGTAQIIESGKHTNLRHNSSFIGFIPYNNPKLVCYILISDPKGGFAGGQVAAPVFKNIMRKILIINDDLLPKDKKQLAIKIDTSLFDINTTNIMPKQKTKTKKK
mgnify:FL=1